ncbi:antibiotic synthetase [Aspergillus candidus]|uniref:Antibiotic synthetase n=1 Tax=Aspergillus candidus TaxID=41067 RepID=A0A2I2FAI5_ASPCN|nr:antibiotic synthetase [Aspergillus candidus]PLB37643.1 antibiotic synthetase [Aspergillus candidus]
MDLSNHISLLDTKVTALTSCTSLSPDGEPDDSLGLAGAIYRRARESPSAPAIEFDGQIISYAQLHCHAALLAKELSRKGVNREEAIGIMTGTGFEQIVAQAAVVYAGCTCCALDPTLPFAQLQYRLTNAGARICLVDQENSNRLKEFEVMPIRLEVLTPSQVTAELAVPPRAMGTGHRTHLMHTSGSTGKPKTVQIQAKSLLHLSRDDRNVPIGYEDRTAQMAMVSFDISLFEIWVTLLRGATIVPMSRTLLSDVPRLARTWRELRVTVMLVPASLLPMVVFAMPTVFSGMQVVYSGGEMPNLPAMKMALEQGPPNHLFNCYGPTECCIFSLVHEVTLEDTKNSVCPLTRLISDTKIEILDPSGQPVPDGESGELFIGGDGVSPGYVNLADKTAERFVTTSQYPALPSGCNFYATGDLVRRTETGEIYVHGRIDNQVKIRGFRVELEGVEAAIMDTGLVTATAACKVQRGDDDLGAALVAFVIPKDPITFTGNQLTDALKVQVAEYLVPQVEVCTEMPLNGHTKIDRERLVREFLEAATKRQVEMAGTQDATTTISRLRKIWHSVLPGCSRHIEDGDTFHALGGTSLQAAMLLIRMKREFSVELTAVMVYEQFTLAQMARYVDEGGAKYTIHAAHNRAYRQDADIYRSLALQPQPGQPPQWDAPFEGRIFMTGATGFVGAFLLQTLLTLPEVKTVVCLVRAKNDEKARNRVMGIQTQYNLCQDSVDYSKLVAVAGDLDSPTLGLGEELFQQLGYWASCIFHSGAHVNYAQPYQSHRDANVLGTANILRFQATGRSKRLFYLSTLNIYGPTGLVDGYTRVGENDPITRFMDAVQYDNGYAQSKWVAEKMVLEAIQDNFPISIFRPGAIFCHSKTGTGNGTDFVARLMVSCMRLKCYPTMPQQSKNFVPVDYLVNAVLHLSRQQCSLGQAYNVVPTLHEQPEDEMRHMFHMLEKACQTPMKEMPYDKWLELLKTLDDNDPLRPLLPMLEEKVFENHCRWEMYSKMPIYGTENLTRDLRDVPGLAQFPVLDQPLLNRFLSELNLI